MLQRLLSIAPPPSTVRWLAWTLGAAAVGCIALGPRSAGAYDSLASECDDGSHTHTCQIAPIQFERTDSLPIEWSFDTGWIPQGSPLQVHLWAGVYANTRVSLAGALQGSWPDAIELRAPGDPGGGQIGFHYGAELGAQALVDVDVFGQSFTWVGDIPYIPQFDFQVKANERFDAWGFAPGITAKGQTAQQRLVQVGISDIIGSSIPGIDGGFELDVAMELSATYVTERIAIDTASGQPVAGGAIQSEEGASLASYSEGAFMELDVHPVGTVDYYGVLHLIPAFYVELLGSSWSIPIADVPIGFPITQTDWAFESKRVHVPLPDLVLSVTEIDFGEVEVGQKNLEPYGLRNAGEASLYVTVLSSAPEVFEVFDPTLTVDPSITADSALRFVPKANGEFEATVYVGSNDPSHPLQTILVRGIGYGAPAEPIDPTPDAAQEGGCACSTPGAEHGRRERRTGAAWAAPLLALGAIGAVTRRARRRSGTRASDAGRA